MTRLLRETPMTMDLNKVSEMVESFVEGTPVTFFHYSLKREKRMTNPSPMVTMMNYKVKNDM